MLHAGCIRGTKYSVFPLFPNRLCCAGTAPHHSAIDVRQPNTLYMRGAERGYPLSIFAMGGAALFLVLHRYDTELQEPHVWQVCLSTAAALWCRLSGGCPWYPVHAQTVYLGRAQNKSVAPVAQILRGILFPPVATGHRTTRLLWLGDVGLHLHSKDT